MITGIQIGEFSVDMYLYTINMCVCVAHIQYQYIALYAHIRSYIAISIHVASYLS